MDTPKEPLPLPASVCSALIGRQTLTESEALRCRGVGAKTFRELIRRGLITGRNEEETVERERRAKDAAVQKAIAQRNNAQIRRRQRVAKVREMIAVYEARIVELREELERLNK